MNAASHQAISGNNAAVLQIEAGQYQIAIDELSAAVRSFKFLLSQSEQEISRTHNSMTIDDCMKETSVPTEPNTSDSSYCYEHPIHIPANNAFRSTYRDCSMISSIVVFNLALSHHLYANQVGTICIEQHVNEAAYSALQKARHLYEIALSMIRDTQARFQKSSSEVIFLLAIFNNLGLVHRKLQNTEASGKCFQYVLSTLMCLTDAGQVSSKLDGFFVNVTSLILKTTVARAA